MDIPREVLQIAEDIKTMRIRGAGKIARSAAKALMIAAEKYRGSRDEFKKYMEKVANIILNTRPTAVSLPNAVMYVMTRLRRSEGDLEELKQTVIASAKEFIDKSLEAVKKIAEYGARMINDGDIIMTHCHSTAAVSIIIEAHKQGKNVKVYSDETRPKFQGRITSSQLAEAGIDVTLVPDSAMRLIVKRVDKVIVGADAIASNGALVNKIGTSQLALAAHEAGVMFLVAAETYKFSPMTFIGELVKIELRDPTEVVSNEWLKENPGVKVLNPSFDVTPPEYIDAIITELGVIPPHAAVLILTESFGWALQEHVMKGIEESEE